MYILETPSTTIGFLQDKNEKLMYSDVDYLDTWKGLEDAVTAGKVKSIGLSNFNKDQIERVLKACRIKPSNLQVSRGGIINKICLAISFL